VGKIFRKTLLKTDINRCWAFFSTPENLNKITPSGIHLILSDFDGKNMFEGQVINYHFNFIMIKKIKWVSKISGIKENKGFIDIQLHGPFSRWHHRHIFKEIKNGVEMIDIIHYKLPFGFLGKLIDKFYVKKRLNEIFNYRENELVKIFKQISP